jgi:predicted membrane protein (TIGR00267 family)
LVNTLFDSTFMQLGIIMGSAFAADPDLRLIIGTLISSSVALGISTGISVYESETLERERRIVELEKALFRNLDNTTITKNYSSYAAVLSFVNFLTPLVCCSIVSIPLVLAAVGLVSVSAVSWISAIFALGIVFAAGVYLGKSGQKNPLIKGIKMTVFGAIAFAIGFVVQSLV